MSEFILMLTRNDVTVPDADDLLDEVFSTPVQHVGFKDIGLSTDAMRRLVGWMHGGRSPGGFVVR